MPGEAGGALRRTSPSAAGCWSLIAGRWEDELTRVLVVEDCRSLADLVAEGLSAQGIAADVAYDGTEAASKLSVNAYDVVLDRALPGIPGDTLTWGQRSSHVVKVRVASSVRGLCFAWYLKAHASHARPGEVDQPARGRAQARATRSTAFLKEPGQGT